MKAQISIEYLILSGFLLGVVLIPTAFFIYSFSGNSIGGSISTEKVRTLGNSLASDSQEIYHLGLYSKQVNVYEFPQGIEQFFILEIDDSYYIGIDAYDNMYLFLSDVPIRAEAYFNTGVPDVDIDECASSSCTYNVFEERVFTSGKKEIKLETKREGDQVKVYILPMIE